MSAEVEQKVKKYEDFIHNKIDPDLKILETKVNSLYKSMESYVNLKNTIEMLNEQGVKSTRMQVDMGCNFYVQAEVEDTDTLIVDIGKGIFVELTRKQALSVCEQKQTNYEKSINALKEKMAQVKSPKIFLGGNPRDNESRRSSGEKARAQVFVAK
eukprot:CAMPEP_0168354616 /NCGR_PEP_ID=MMETSP0213-20121227/24010_1 /TAXON_ID=151035 /ORGANISM="Euplotes harpa, Strain FSP1.4" /LENGTH=155 /DNA_ID=CAMNT_0008366567 /DNA_START=16 /DNA_END=479 /DNA_ORIENTATION=-